MPVRANRVRSAALRFAVAGCVLLPGMIACTGTVPRPEVAAGFVGGYRAIAGRTAVNLEVTEDSFTAVTFTDPGPGVPAARADSARPASAPGSEPATWVVFTGDVIVSGATVTVSVTRVERDGQALQGAALAAYTMCSTTATAGDAFAGEVMDCRPDWTVLDFAPDLSDRSARPNSVVLYEYGADAVGGPGCRRAGGRPLVFTVILSPAASGTVTVDWATSDLTAAESEGFAGAGAAAGADYAAGNGTLTFRAGQSSRAFTVATIEDDAIEGNEAFKVELSNPSGAAIAMSTPEHGGLRGRVGIGVIVDDDHTPCSSIELSFDASLDDTKIAVAFREGRIASGDAPPIVLDRDNYGDFLFDISTGGPADLDYDVFYVIGAIGDRAAFRVQHSPATWGSRR